MILQPVIVGQQGCRPGRERDQDPGDEMVDVPAADADVAKRSATVADRPGESRTLANEPRNPARMLNSTVSLRGAVA